MGPGGSGLPGALGACALARTTDANRKIAGTIRCNKQNLLLSSQNWMCPWLWTFLFFALVPVDWVARLGFDHRENALLQRRRRLRGRGPSTPQRASLREVRCSAQDDKLERGLPASVGRAGGWFPGWYRRRFAGSWDLACPWCLAACDGRRRCSRRAHQ